MALPFNTQIRTAPMTKWFEMTNRGPSANANFLPLPGGPRAWPFASIGTSLPFRPFGQWVVGTPRCKKSPLHSRDGRGLTTDGTQTIRTGRYEITLENGLVSIYDAKARRSVQRGADLEVSFRRGDGREEQTFDLPDGSTVVLRRDGDDTRGGFAVQDLAVLKGEEALVIVGGGERRAGRTEGATRNMATAVRDAWDQAATTQLGAPARNHTQIANAREFVGRDPNLPVDGPAAPGWGGTGQVAGILGENDNALWHSLGGTIEQLQGQLEQKLQALEELRARGGDGAMDSIELQRAFMEIQQVQDAIRQVVTTMTNLQKADHESRMAIARNLA